LDQLFIWNIEVYKICWAQVVFGDHVQLNSFEKANFHQISTSQLQGSFTSTLNIWGHYSGKITLWLKGWPPSSFTTLGEPASTFTFLSETS
jgi:hypothetical protein